EISPPWTPILPSGLDSCRIPSNVLDQYWLARAPVTFGARDALTSSGGPHSVPMSNRNEGSNNWVIGPSKTTTGRPILANDPHRSLDVPSVRYVTHLVAPGLDVIGAGEPALPGISIGHNENIAFGITVFDIAQE